MGGIRFRYSVLAATLLVPRCYTHPIGRSVQTAGWTAAFLAYVFVSLLVIGGLAWRLRQNNKRNDAQDTEPTQPATAGSNGEPSRNRVSSTAQADPNVRAAKMSKSRSTVDGFETVELNEVKPKIRFSV
jgi:hypothetical protein